LVLILVVLCAPVLLAACDPGDVTNAVTPGYTPQQMREAYGVTPLIAQGHDGTGQTVVVIESFGSPTLQQDMNTFCTRYGLPPITLQILAPLGSVPFDPKNSEMTGWVGESTLDVELIHAIAPGAKIVVLTSPVDETEGTVGLPQFLQLEQYAVSHHLGNIISQSFGASEYTLTDSAGRQQVQQWDRFYHQATTQDGITFFASSGDSGATDAANIFSDPAQEQYVDAPTSSFPNDDPWVTSVGGTTINLQNDGADQPVAWNSNGGASGGGFSAFFSEPAFQQGLPASMQSELNHRRGLPDVAADADPSTGMGAYNSQDKWFITGGTSASAPVWAALAAIADQMAGHPLGFLNPALYQIAASSKYAQDFRDVTAGNNSFAAGGVSVQGYAAAPGWDPVTGMGEPIAYQLLPDLIAQVGTSTSTSYAGLVLPRSVLADA
jgi:subtilase family serine protease